MLKCPQCMQDWNGSHCQACGYEKGRSSKVFVALPQGTKLNGRYRLGNALGESRQAVAYAAWDEGSSRAVLLEEFYPKSNATRTESGQVISKRNAGLFEHARDFFSNMNIQTEKRLNCTDSFLAGGTAWRVYLPLPGIPLHEQAEALLDNPVLFRDNQDRILMTINALAMPELPAKRGFMPSGSIARQRRRRLIRAAVLIAALACALLLGALFLTSSQQAVSMTLRIALHPEQQVWMDPVQGQEAPEDITQQVLTSAEREQRVLTQRTEFDYALPMKPGNYAVTIKSKDGEERTEFLVQARKPGIVDINELHPPLPVVAFDAGAAGDNEAAAFIKKLKDLGYLDFAENYTQIDQEVLNAYRAFAKDHGIQTDEEQPGIFQEDWDRLMNSSMTPLPYFKAGDDNARSRHAIKRLADLYYLFDHPGDAFDDKAQAAYKAFLKTNGLPEMEDGQVTIAAARVLFGKNAKKRAADVVINESKGEKVSRWLGKLVEQGLLDAQEVQLRQEVFTDKAFEAYKAFVSKTEGMREPVTDKDNPNQVYLLDIGKLENAQKLSLPKNSFLIDYGDGVRLVQKGQEPVLAAVYAYTDKDLVPLEIEISIDIRHAAKGIRIALNNEVFIELPKEVNKFSLQADRTYQLSLHVETRKGVDLADKSRYFPLLEPVALGSRKQQLAFNRDTMDLQAADDYAEYGALPLPAGIQAWVMDGKLFFNQKLDDVQKAAWQQLYEKQDARSKRIQAASGDGQPSVSLPFHPMAFNPKDAFRTLYYGTEAQMPGLGFKLDPGPEEVMNARKLESLRLTPGKYTLSLYRDGQKLDSLLADKTYRVQEGPLSVTPGFAARTVRSALKVSAYSLDGKPGLLTPKNLKLDSALKKALLAPEEDLVDVAMNQGLDPLVMAHFKSSFRVEDAHGNKIPIPDAGGKLRLQPGTYRLFAGPDSEFASQELKVKAKEQAAFQFDSQVLNKMKDKVLQAAPPEWMYAANNLDKQLMVGVVHADPDKTPLSQQEQEDLFTYFTSSSGQLPVTYKRFDVKFVQHGYTDACPVQAVRFWHRNTQEKHAIQLDLQGNQRNLLILSLYVKDSLATEFNFQPAALPGAGAEPSQVEGQAATTTLKELLEAAGEAAVGNEVFNFLVIADFISATKLVPGEQGSKFEFNLLKDAKDAAGELIAHVNYEGKAGSIQDWVLLPREREAVLNQDGNQTHKLKVEVDGKTIAEKLDTKRPPKAKTTPTPAPTPVLTPVPTLTPTPGDGTQEEQTVAPTVQLPSTSDTPEPAPNENAIDWSGIDWKEDPDGAITKLEQNWRTQKDKYTKSRIMNNLPYGDDRKALDEKIQDRITNLEAKLNGY